MLQEETSNISSGRSLDASVDEHSYRKIEEVEDMHEYITPFFPQDILSNRPKRDKVMMHKSSSNYRTVENLRSNCFQEGDGSSVNSNSRKLESQISQSSAGCYNRSFATP